MPFKVEQLDVWRMALEYIDMIDVIAHALPRSEDYNLKSQITRDQKWLREASPEYLVDSGPQDGKYDPF